MRIATVTTPNTPELEALAGMKIETVEDRHAAAERLIRDHGCRAVLAKGGHFPGIEIHSTDLVTGEKTTSSTDGELWDALFTKDDDGAIMEIDFVYQRLETRHTHGTGCTLASAIAVGLAWRHDLDRAVRDAGAYVQAALRASPWLGKGHGPIGHTLGEHRSRLSTGKITDSSFRWNDEAWIPKGGTCPAPASSWRKSIPIRSPASTRRVARRWRGRWSRRR